jgi:hypothetical protein
MSRQNPIPTNKNNPCVICGNDDGDCRVHHVTGDPWCMKLKDIVVGSVQKTANGSFKAKQLTSDGQWMIFNPTNERGETFKREYKPVERKSMANLMPSEVRDKNYRKLVSYRGLSQRHRQKLLDRGFLNDEIDLSINQNWLCSWESGISSAAYPDDLCGVNVEKNIFHGGSGIAFAYQDKCLIVGLNIANDSRDGAKYYPLSSRKSGGAIPNLPNGELPIFQWVHPEATEVQETWICEGTIKGLLTGFKLWRTNKNIQVIGIGGNNFLNYYKSIKPLLTIKNIFCPDAGMIDNSTVWENYSNFIKRLDQDKFNILVAWWGQISKDDSDIDELTNFSEIKYLSLDEFLSLAFVDTSAKEAKQESINDWAWEQWVRNRKFTPDIIMKDEYFQFPKLPNSNAMISVMASLGKGKTQAIIQEIIRAGNGVHIIGYRNNLLFQTIARAKENGLNIYHLNDDGTDLLADSFAYLALCLDSIHKIEGYFKGRDIILDESCSVLIHALNGGTLGDNQAKAIRILSTALKECNRVFLLDGNNSDLYTNFYHSLCPDKKLIKIQNTHGSPKHNIKIVDAVSDGEIKSRNRTPLIEMLLDKEVIPWIYCDSKERTKVINQMFLDNSDKQGYCLNSETAGDDWAKEFLADPDNFILDKKPDYIMVSPTAESGISVSLRGYFTDKFTFFAGVTGTNGQGQAMFRLRDENINHYVFCPEQSMAKDRNSPHTYSLKQYQNILNDRILQSSILASESANNPTRALELMGAAIARTKDDWWEMSAKLGVIDNYEMNNLRKCLIYALEEAGHNVEVIQSESSEELKKAESEAKITVQKTHAKELNLAVKFETVEKAKEAAKSNPRKFVQRRIEKTFLLERIPGIEDSQLWGDEFIYQTHIKHKEYIRNIERYWFVKNFDVSQKRHETKWFYEATKEDFYTARVSNMTHSVIWALRELDILKFTDGREYHKDSEDVVNLIQQLRDSKDIRIALKMESMPPAKDNLKIISSLLGMIGFKNKSQGKKFVGDIRLNHYQAVPTGFKEELEDGEFDLMSAREDILTAIGKRFTAWMQSEKAVIDWEEIVNDEQVAVEETSNDPLIPLIVEQLEIITTREQCYELDETITEAQKRAAWNALTQDVRDRIKNLFTEDQQKTHS